jgi:hypothetical protein
MICWSGKRLAGAEHARASDCMNKICGGELSSKMTRVSVKKGNEDETFLHYFKDRLILCDDKYYSGWHDDIKTKGAMFRI